MRSELDTVRALIAAFAVAIASFVLAYAISTAASHHIQADEQKLRLDSSPSLYQLTDARSEVHAVQLLTDDLVARRPGSDRGALLATRARLEADVQGYLGLPLFSGEQPFWNEVRDSAAAFEAAQQRVLAALDSGSEQQGRLQLESQLRPAAARADQALAEAIAFHRRTVAGLGADIDEARARSRRMSLLLIFIATVVSVFAALLLRRVVRRASAIQRERARTAEERAQELEVFAARVAHDITNPLTAAAVAIDAALRRIEDPEHSRRALQVSRRGLSNANLIIQALLDFARSGGKPEPGASAKLAQSVQWALTELEPRARDARIQITAGELPDVSLGCSPGVLASVLMNLVGNALKYMGESPRREVVVRGSLADGTVRVEVADTGPGLPPELEPESVFGMYVRGKGTGQPGLGLGLATVKRLVEAHGGKCGVRSRSGEGCTFWFELPRTAPVIGTIGPASAPGPQSEQRA